MLGFDVHPGGHHTGQGTYNALIRFGLDYIELFSVYDENEARHSLHAHNMVDFLAQREGGLVGYVLATTNIQQEAERFRTSNLDALGPSAMQRKRPDGHLLTWSLLLPNGLAWGQPWPFLIQWNVPDEQRLAWEKPGTHLNGVIGCKGIAVAVRHLESAIDLYQRQLGLELVRKDVVPTLAALRATFRVGTFGVDLLAPHGEGPVQHQLNTIGEMPFELRLAVRDLEQTRAFFTEHNLSSQPNPADPSSIVLAPEQTLGVRFVFTA
jgi:catechol 2,3-dioxygenase-like lactoylglutathione lyase family enzyme